jgi:hypothetical protein
MLLKVVLSCVPTAVTAVIITTAIRAAIRPYSIAVAPHLSAKNLLICERMAFPFLEGATKSLHNIYERWIWPLSFLDNSKSKKFSAATIAASIASFQINETVVDGVVVSLTPKITFFDKVAALDKAMKHQGIYEQDSEQIYESMHITIVYKWKHDQTMCQHMKRFSRLTAAHSKTIENRVHMVALYTTWYNFAHTNSAVRVFPAMAAHLTDRLWDVGDIVKLIDDWEANALVSWKWTDIDAALACRSERLHEHSSGTKWGCSHSHFQEKMSSQQSERFWALYSVGCPVGKRQLACSRPVTNNLPGNSPSLGRYVSRRSQGWIAAGGSMLWASDWITGRECRRIRKTATARAVELSFLAGGRHFPDAHCPDLDSQIGEAGLMCSLTPSSTR